MFDRILGNDAAKTSLTRMIDSGRLPNSLLFTGHEGVGKREFALEVARALVCTSTVDGQGCGKCSACERVVKFEIPKPEKKDDFKQVFFSGHPDVGTVVAYNRNILVDAIRALEQEANFRPFEAKARLFLIDDADKMNDAASNALLKTLEEPPSTTYIILVTSKPEALLQTIHSRCQVVRFAPLTVDSVEAFLLNDKSYAAADASLAARMSKGSIGTAIGLDIEKLRNSRDSMLDLVESGLGRRDIPSVLRASELINDAKNKDDFELNLEIFETLLRDSWLLSQGLETESLANPDVAERLNAVARSSSLGQIESLLAGVEELRQSLEVNINRKVATDALFAKMAA